MANEKKTDFFIGKLLDYENIAFLREVKKHGKISLFPQTIEEYF